MKVLSAEFVTSAAPRLAAGRLAQSRPTAEMYGIPRDGLPQIAFAGRSNVGKSSLLNALCRAPIARTSGAPGKTRLVNVYRVAAEGGPGGPGRWSVYFVDLPGYGYARGDAGRELAAVAEGYFASRGSGFGRQDSARPAGSRESRHVLLLVDSRHPGLESDIQAHAWLTQAAGAPHVVATKIDKLSRAERARSLKTLEDTFGTAALPVSASSGGGLDDLWKLIAKISRNT